MTATVDVPVPTLVGQSVVVEPDAVRILDRRVFPFERTWVTCRSHEDVARAIEEMVTQSLGPLFAAAGGMTLAAREADRLPTARARQEYLTGAGRRLGWTRQLLRRRLACHAAGSRRFRSPPRRHQTRR